MRKFKVIVRWPRTVPQRIDETIVEADRYYQSKYGATTYNFIKGDEQIASFPARTTMVMEMK